MIDIPSRLTRQQEIKYLCESRSLEEEEILLLSALEELKGNPDQNTAYNKANTFNSLGLHYYRKGDLKKAIEKISEAIRLFNDILIKFKDSKNCQRELATAFFNLAEVFTEHSRIDNNDEDINKAIFYYKKCIEIDKKFGNDTNLAQKRISDLIKRNEINIR